MRGTYMMLQGVGQDIADNLATKKYADPNQGIYDGIQQNLLKNFGAGVAFEFFPAVHEVITERGAAKPGVSGAPTRSHRCRTERRWNVRPSRPLHRHLLKRNALTEPTTGATAKPQQQQGEPLGTTSFKIRRPDGSSDVASIVYQDPNQKGGFNTKDVSSLPNLWPHLGKGRSS